MKLVLNDPGKGLYSNSTGGFRATAVSGSVFTGLQAPDGSYNIIQVLSTDLPYGLLHPCGAIRVVSTATEGSLYAANGAYSAVITTLGALASLKFNISTNSQYIGQII